MFTRASQLSQHVGNEQRLALPLSEQLVPDLRTAGNHATVSAVHKQLQNDEAIQRSRSLHTEEKKVVTINDRYQLLLPANDGGWIQGFDTYTNTNLHCHIYPTKRFLELSQLLSMKVNGIRHPEDIQGLGHEVAVLYPETYGALHGYLKQQKNLSEFEAASFFGQIVSIINNAHKQGVALRDLKLKKFVFTDPKRTTIGLSDLEDAVIVSGLEVGGDLLNNRHGCPAYVAPEMLQPGPYSGRAADMWSAGVIMYTLLVGHYPFYDVKAPDLFMKIRSGHYHIPDYVSYSARSLICSLLSYEPSLRPSAEGVLHHPWFTNPPKQSELSYSYHSKSTENDQTVPTHKLL